jgi:hypothetical protein
MPETIDPWVSRYPTAVNEPIDSYPTKGGHTVEVAGPDAWGGYSDHCTGCGSTTHSEDVPAGQAEAVMQRSASHHAKHCLVFPPALADMESSHYGLLISCIDEDGELVVVGGSVTERRALAAVSAYTRTTCGPEDHQALRDRLRNGEMALVIQPTVFLRESDGTWTAERRPDASAAAWLIWK